LGERGSKVHSGCRLPTPSLLHGNSHRPHAVSSAISTLSLAAMPGASTHSASPLSPGTLYTSCTLCMSSGLLSPASPEYALFCSFFRSSLFLQLYPLPYSVCLGAYSLTVPHLSTHVKTPRDQGHLAGRTYSTIRNATTRLGQYVRSFLLSVCR